MVSKSVLSYLLWATFVKHTSQNSHSSPLKYTENCLGFSDSGMLCSSSVSIWNINDQKCKLTLNKVLSDSHLKCGDELSPYG